MVSRELYPNRCVCTCPPGAKLDDATGACNLDPAIKACYAGQPNYCAGGTVTAGDGGCTCDCVNGKVLDEGTKACVSPTVERCAKKNEGNYCKGGTPWLQGTQCRCRCPARTTEDAKDTVCVKDLTPWCQFKMGASHCAGGTMLLDAKEEGCTCSCPVGTDFVKNGQPCRPKACTGQTMANCSNYGFPQDKDGVCTCDCLYVLP